MIQIHGLTQAQRVMADLLWSCDTMEEVELVISKLGHEAKVVMDLIILASVDEQVEEMDSYPEAEMLLSKLFG